MIVFKNYFKIVKSFLPTIILFSVIFLSFAILTTSSNVNSSGQMFATAKPKVVVIDQDGSLFSKALMEYVGESMELEDEFSDGKSLEDALFYRQIDLVMTIPKNYGVSFLTGATPVIELNRVPDSYASKLAEMLVEQFLNVAMVYQKSELSEEKWLPLLKEDLKTETNVTLIEGDKSALGNANYYYNFCNYVLLALLILIVAMIQATYEEKNIKKRNLISAVPYRIFNRSLFLGNLCLTILLWGSYAVLSMILYPSAMFSSHGVLLLMNSFLFAISALSIGFFIGHLVLNKQAQSGIVNVLALGTSFICGAFVPQEYLGNFVLGIGHIFPSYWYITNNNLIVSLSHFDWNSLQPIMINMGVLVLFTIVLFLFTNVITRIRRKVG